MNPNRPEHRQRALREVEYAQRSLEKYKATRKRLFEDYTGDVWSRGPLAQKSSQERVVIPLMSQVINTYVMTLAANRPRAKVTTQYRSLLAFARMFEATINNYLDDIRIEHVMQEVVLEACFSMGIARIGLLPAGCGEYGDPGRPGVESISFDDWFHDTRAKTDERMLFMGHTYEASLESLREDDSLDQGIVKKLRPERRPTGDVAPQDPVKDFEAGHEWEEYDDTTILVDYYLPKERKLVTFDHRFEHVLAVRDWEGPDRGPYRFLRFQRVPDSIMGLPGAYGLMPLFRAINSVHRKLLRQAMNQKRGTVVDMSSDRELANKVKTMPDGGVIPANLKHIGVYQAPGIDGNLGTLGVQLQDLFNRSSGNYEHMAGLGPSADTASQERIIQGNVGAMVSTMQSAVANFSREIMSDLAHWIWKDEVLTMPGELPIRDSQLGVEISIPFEWMPGDREGEYVNYNFDIAPYSMSYKSPSDQAAALMGVMNQVIVPLLPMMQEQGVGVDFSAALEAIARLSDLPELREILMVQEPPANSPAGPQGGRKNESPVQHKTYTRRSVSTGGTPSSRRNATIASYEGSATPQEAGLMGVQAGGV